MNEVRMSSNPIDTVAQNRVDQRGGHWPEIWEDFNPFSLWGNCQSTVRNPPLSSLPYPFSGGKKVGTGGHLKEEEEEGAPAVKILTLEFKFLALTVTRRDLSRVRDRAVQK